MFKSLGQKQLLVFALGLIILGFMSVGQAWWGKKDAESVAEGATELTWDDLVPEDFRPAENPLTNMTQEQIDKLFDGSEESNKELDEIEEILSYAPTVPGLDGERVKIPGYVVPLDFDGQTKLKEFLLVPYYGACIHTPPPPANQVVHAESSTTIDLENPYYPVWLIGTLKTETVQSALAESGYRLDVEGVLPYEVPK
ncbi:MAG: DUF3299 domain-containing protein [Gammaproteobacteria bacterium]|nr:DUF3299 domain-containing protein [Gammaproteobacteria bacterium]